MADFTEFFDGAGPGMVLPPTVWSEESLCSGIIIIIVSVLRSCPKTRTHPCLGFTRDAKNHAIAAWQARTH